MTGRWLTFFVNIYCKEGGWEGSTWKCRASYFSPNTACCRESKGIKQPSLPTANNRDVLSDAYINQTGKTIRHNSVPEGIFIDVLMTHMCLYHHLQLIAVVSAKKGWDVQLCQSSLSLFSLFCLFYHISIYPLIPLSGYISILNSPSALAQALIIAGSLLNSHNALL